MFGLVAWGQIVSLAGGAECGVVRAWVSVMEDRILLVRQREETPATLDEWLVQQLQRPAELLTYRHDRRVT